MLRRFIPKWKSIAEYGSEALDYFSDKINGLQRKILGYSTPEQLFEQECEGMRGCSKTHV
jgi:IS30 family transposase